MLEIAVIVLLITWGLGLLSSYTIGGAIHLCLVAALILLAIKLLRKPSQSRSRGAIPR